MTKRIAPRTERWGTPQRQVCGEKKSLLHLTRKQREERYDLNQFSPVPWMPNQEDRRVSKILWSMRYLGTYIIKDRQFRCSVTNAKHSFNRSTKCYLWQSWEDSLRRSYSPVSEEQMPAHSPIWAWVLLSAQSWSAFPWLCGHEIFNEIIQNSKQGHHRWMSIFL